MRKQIRIEASNLKVAYERTLALHIPTFDICGGIIAVIGHNGAGKSTLIKSMLKLLPVLSGELKTSLVNEHGAQIELVPEKHMSFCPETGSVFADISVESYVKLWCRLKKGDGDFYKKRGRTYIELLKLEALLPKLGRELSKGQRRRVQTAVGFLSEPALFLFDEPFDGLDVQKTSELAEMIREQSTERAFLISSHRMDVVERLADLVIVLKEGEIVASGALEEVCSTLCRQGFVVSNLHDPDTIFNILRTKYPASLVSKVGHEIRLFGNEFSREALVAALYGADTNGMSITERKAGLVDAMNYHLMSLP